MLAGSLKKLLNKGFLLFMVVIPLLVHSRLFSLDLLMLYRSTLESEILLELALSKALAHHFLLKGLMNEKFKLLSLCNFISKRSSKIYSLEPC